MHFYEGNELTVSLRTPWALNLRLTPSYNPGIYVVRNVALEKLWLHFPSGKLMSRFRENGRYPMNVFGFRIGKNMTHWVDSNVCRINICFVVYDIENTNLLCRFCAAFEDRRSFLCKINDSRKISCATTLLLLFLTICMLLVEVGVFFSFW